MPMTTRVIWWVRYDIPSGSGVPAHSSGANQPRARGEKMMPAMTASRASATCQWMKARQKISVKDVADSSPSLG